MRRILPLVAIVALGLGLAPRAAAQDDARAIVERAIKARGGDVKLAKLTASRSKSKGTLEVLGMTLSMTMETSVQMPDRMKSVIEFEVSGQKIDATQVFNKDKAWVHVRAGDNVQTIDLDGDVLKAMKEGLHTETVGTLTPLLKGKVYKLSSLGEIKVTGRAALGVKVEAEGHKEVNLYFDKESGLPVKIESSSVNSELKEVAQEVLLSDYKDFDGIKRAAKYVVIQDGKKVMEVEVTELKVVDKIDDSEFEKP